MILLRHGQSEFNVHFNVTRRDPGIVDPALTPLGHEEATRAAEAFAGAGLARIICSPYTRALQTAQPIAQALGLPIFINPVVGERVAFTCDIGTPRAELAAQWPHFDFSHIDEIWWSALEESEAAFFGRADRFRAEMAALPDWADTLVVSHWGFIRAMTGQPIGNGAWLRCDPTMPAPATAAWPA